MKTVPAAIYRLEIKNRKDPEQLLDLFDKATASTKLFGVFQNVIASLPTEITQELIEERLEALEQQNDGTVLKITVNNSDLTKVDGDKHIYIYGSITVSRIAEYAPYRSLQTSNLEFTANPDEHVRDFTHHYFIGISKNHPTAFIMIERHGNYHARDFLGAYESELRGAVSEGIIKMDPHISDVEIEEMKKNGLLSTMVLTEKKASPNADSKNKLKDKKLSVTHSIKFDWAHRWESSAIESTEEKIHYVDVAEMLKETDNKTYTVDGYEGEYSDVQVIVEYKGRRRSFRVTAQKQFLPIYDIERVSTNASGQIVLDSWYKKARDYYLMIFSEAGLER